MKSVFYFLTIELTVAELLPWTWYKISVTSEIFQSINGVDVSYTEALKITFEQIMKILNSLPPSGDVTFYFKDGYI